MAKHLITGGAGFIGSHLAELLLKRGEHVSVIDNLSTGRFSNIAPLEKNERFRFFVDDIQNEHLLEELIRDTDYIYHLAASVGVRIIIERPIESIINNIMGTEVVLRNACRYRKPLVITSTSEVYGKSERPTFREDDDRIMGPTCKSRWGYAESKAIDEFLALAYFSEKHLPVAIVRLFNTVGPRQIGRYGMVVPTFVRQALLDAPIGVFGDGSQSRCFAHVLDVVPALAELVKHPRAYGSVYNVGSQEEISIKSLAERVIEATGSKSNVRLIPYVQAYPPGFEDMERRMPDLTRLHNLIGYSPKYKLDQILTDVIADVREQLASRDSLALSAV
ncbi:MAG TPA: GDP-mannose 4,6-dehydratase [Candidatus Acidoferrales bacterium]|nr:GDP-mannose 4,6-dehydratase [Candidatus Acidoferrales bacterium]